LTSINGGQLQPENQNQSRSELAEHLREQLDFLRASSSRFDDGIEAEAKRMATTIRLLVHDTNRSFSLLEQLDVKRRLWWFDTGHRLPPAGPGLVMRSFALATMQISTHDGLSFFAPFDENLVPSRKGPPTRFKEWWTRIVLEDETQTGFSRRDLVLALANKDGGAHIDPGLDEPYRQLSRHNSFGWVSYTGDQSGQIPQPSDPPRNSVVAASVRQIAFETARTLEAQLGP
jgi:hypothetical protein